VVVVSVVGVVGVVAVVAIVFGPGVSWGIGPSGVWLRVTRGKQGDKS